MKRLMLASILMAGLSGAAVADHNSPFGAGWANMPNDVHNMRLDETVSDEEFWDFVQGGGGGDSVNRYADTTTDDAAAGQRPDATGPVAR